MRWISSHDCPAWVNVPVAVTFGFLAVMCWRKAHIDHGDMFRFAFYAWACLVNIDEFLRKGAQ